MPGKKSFIEKQMHQKTLEGGGGSTARIKQNPEQTKIFPGPELRQL